MSESRKPLFSMPLALRWRDLDAFQHVNNSNFLTYLEEARIRWFGSLDKPWVNDEMTIPYPADVVVELYADKVGNTSCTVGHRIASADGATLYADGHVVMVWINPKTGRPIPLPDSIREMASH